jgi:hypothetical protein
MGVNEGKALCQWFGPNTIAQCLKKLAIYDGWSQLAVHVAMDNLLISSDVKVLAATPWSDCVSFLLDFCQKNLNFSRPNPMTKRDRKLTKTIPKSRGDLF